MITRLAITDFVSLAAKHPILDVRSPGEFQHAHIPNAYSLPLFTDEERKVVGTAYKQEGKQQAVRIGLASFGHKMLPLVDEATAICKQFYGEQEGGNIVLVHCWRGGMRSAGVAWLLDLYGFKVYTAAGGYKAFRNWVLQQFLKDYNLIILGGYTGSGKTELLEALQQAGQAVIALEELAAHKGSAFGAIGMPGQPSQEMFENLLASGLAEKSAEQPSVIWLEDESMRIGKLNIPAELFNTMRKKRLLFLSVPFEARLNHIIKTYGCLNRTALAEAIERIQKRLGGLETKNALRFLEANDVAACFSILLQYYDRCYLKALNKREDIQKQIKKIDTTTVDTGLNAALLLQVLNQAND